MADKLKQTELADRLDLSVRQVRNLEKEGMPSAWPAALHWYVERKVSDARAQFATSARLHAAKLRQEEARAAALELNVSRARADVVPMDYLQRQVRTLFELTASTLKGLPARLAADLVGRASELEARQVLEDAIDRELLRLRDAVTAAPLEDPSDDDAPEGAAA